MMMHRAVVVAAIVLATSEGRAAPRAVTAITADVYKQLPDLERALARADVRQATASAAVMERYINELKALAPTDTRSKGIVDKFRGWLDALLDAAGELERMSATDSAVDGVEARCAALDSSLEQKVNELAAEGSADARVKILKVAGDFSKSVADTFKKLTQVDLELGKKQELVKRFRTGDPRWRGVETSLQGAAARIRDGWSANLKKAHATCDALMEGERHPKVAVALARIGKPPAGFNPERALSDLRREANEWVKHAKSMYMLDCDNLGKLWDAWCSEDPEELDGEGKARAEALSRSIVAKQRAAIDAVLAQRKLLEDHAQPLLVNAYTKADAAEIMRSTDGEAQKVNRIEGREEWKGYHDPVRQFVIRYGQEEHTKMESKYKCAVADVPFGSAGRPDCITVSGGCHIYEFKPRGGSNDGTAQCAKYVPEVNRTYSEYLEAIAATPAGKTAPTPPADHAPRGLLDAIEKTCWDAHSKRTSFTCTPEYYDRCERRVECIR